jgi:hypothetical protein
MNAAQLHHLHPSAPTPIPHESQKIIMCGFNSNFSSSTRSIGMGKYCNLNTLGKQNFHSKMFI